MVDEVVGSIIEAEDKAERLTREGAEEAKRILSQARLDSETARASCVKACRLRLAEARRKAEERAENAYAQALRQGEEAAAALRAARAENRQTAVDAVLAAILP